MQEGYYGLHLESAPEKGRKGRAAGEESFSRGLADPTADCKGRPSELFLVKGRTLDLQSPLSWSVTGCVLPREGTWPQTK